MSGLYSTLNSSVMAISAQSRAIETAGKNLANVNNPNYSRQRVLLGDKGTILTPQGAESMGVEAIGLQQMRDQLLDQQVAREISQLGSFTAEQNGYQRAQAGLGQSIDRTSATSGSSSTSDNGIGAALADFFNAFQSFATSPTDTAQRQSLLQTASILTDRFQAADQRLGQVQSDLNAQINTDVGTVNTLLTTIADLNGQIARFEVNAPGSAVDLRDERQAKLEELAAKLPVSVVDAGGGQIQLTAKDSLGGTVVILDKTTVPSPVAFTGTALTAGSPVATLAPASGSIYGSLTARDGAIQSLRDNLDALAGQLVTSVNQVYNPSGTAGDFFAASGTTAGTIQLSSVTASTLRASSGGAAGDNSVALAIAQLASKKFDTASGDAIDGTFSGFYSSTVTGIGQALASANARVDDQTNIQKLVKSQRDAVSGVSLDEEMADLMKFQRAFQASSRVFNVVDELLDTVVNRLGV